MKTFTESLVTLGEGPRVDNPYKVIKPHRDLLQNELFIHFTEAAVIRLSLDFDSAFRAVSRYGDDESSETRDWAVPVLKDGKATMLVVKVAIPLDKSKAAEYYVANTLAEFPPPTLEELEGYELGVNEGNTALKAQEIAQELDFASGDDFFQANLEFVEYSSVSPGTYQTAFIRKLSNYFTDQELLRDLQLEGLSCYNGGIDPDQNPRILYKGEDTFLLASLAEEYEGHVPVAILDAVTSLPVSMSFVAARLDYLVKNLDLDS